MKSTTLAKMQECLVRHRRRWDSICWVSNPAVRKALGRWVVFRSHYLRQMIRDEQKRLLVERRKAKKWKAKERRAQVRGKSNSRHQQRRNARGKTTARS